MGLKVADKIRDRDRDRDKDNDKSFMAVDDNCNYEEAYEDDICSETSGSCSFYISDIIT